MAYQSKTYSLSDEVVAAIDAARARGLTPNKFLLHLLAFEQSAMTNPKDMQIDAAGPELSSGRGKATIETRSRSLREKGDGKR